MHRRGSERSVNGSSSVPALAATVYQTERDTDMGTESAIATTTITDQSDKMILPTDGGSFK